MIADVFPDEKKKKREEESERTRVRSCVTHERKKKNVHEAFSQRCCERELLQFARVQYKREE